MRLIVNYGRFFLTSFSLANLANLELLTCFSCLSWTMDDFFLLIVNYWRVFTANRELWTIFPDVLFPANRELLTFFSCQSWTMDDFYWRFFLLIGNYWRFLLVNFAVFFFRLFPIFVLTFISTLMNTLLQNLNSQAYRELCCTCVAGLAKGRQRLFPEVYTPPGSMSLLNCQIY